MSIGLPDHPFSGEELDKIFKIVRWLFTDGDDLGYLDPVTEDLNLSDDYVRELNDKLREYLKHS